MRKSKEKILNFWEGQAISKIPGNLVTHRDFNQVSIEINLLLNLLRKNDSLLDVGCGNGFATSVYAKKCKRTVGVDYSKKMIAAARKAFGQNKQLSFNVADVLSLEYKRGLFSAIISTRCLINLTGWEEQKQAIKNMHGILNVGGRLILVEGIRQGRERLNHLRTQLGLSPMPKVWHNIDFDEDKLLPFLKKRFIIKKNIGIGFYDVLTRAFYPSCIYPKEPLYGQRFQTVAEKLYYIMGPNAGDYYSREAFLELVKK